jgi:hypothetical protein
MTSIESLYTSALVIAGIVLYARGYEVNFGNDADKKPAAKEKQPRNSPRPPS